jgi:hypothetical protein
VCKDSRSFKKFFHERTDKKIFIAPKTIRPEAKPRNQYSASAFVLFMVAHLQENQDTSDNLKPVPDQPIVVQTWPAKSRQKQ